MVFELFSGVDLNAASLLLRAGLGVIFVIHGYPKLKSGGKAAGQWLQSMGIPYGFGLFAGVVEFFGGIALLLGMLTPIVAVLSALWMLSTTWFAVAKMKKKFMGGYEIDVALLILAVVLALIGGGIFSIDHLLLGF